MKRAKIIFIIDSAFPNQSGGRETWLSQMANLLHDDFDITVISLMNYTDRKEPFYEVPEDVNIRAIPTFLNLGIGGRFSALKQLFGGLLLFSFVAGLLAMRYTFTRTPTFIIAMNPGHAFLPSLFARGSLVRRIACVRGNYLKEMGNLFHKADRYSGIARSLQRHAFERADLILTNGYDSSAAIKPLVSNPARIVTLPNGVDYNLFSNVSQGQVSGPKVVGMVCTLSALRGTDAALAAAANLKSRHETSFRMMLVGKGDAPRYTRLTHDLGLEGIVEIRGETQDVGRVLAEMDIVLALTDGWGISHSLLEEMSAGKAVIALDSPAYTQILEDGESALLVGNLEPQTLADAIERLIKDEEMMSRLGKKAQEEAAKFDWSIAEERFRGVLANLSKSGRG
jgi:glycosyltransferase involved in cell wall biosynthesis